MYSTLSELKELPREVQIEIAEKVGGGFGTDVSVEREYGKYSVSSCVCLRKHYAPDHKGWFFNRKTVEQDGELALIIKKEDEEYERWLNNEGKDFNWDSLSY